MVDPGHDLRFPVHAAHAATMEQGSLEGRLSVLPQETEVRGRGGGVMIRKEYSDRPSKEGLSRYKYFKGFYFDGISRYPCTCKPECPDPCNGNCGCESCRNVYLDFRKLIELKR